MFVAWRRMQLAAVSIGVFVVMSIQHVAGAPWTCVEKPTGVCVRRHGRLSSRNGIALTIWLIGTSRIVRVANDLDSLPFSKYLEMTSPEHSDIYADFDICPLEPVQPGRMQSVCVTGAEKLVVQNVQGVPPAFRIPSEWPADAPAVKRNKD